MGASLGGLRRRVERMQLELQKRQERSSRFASSKSQVNLPGVDKWPEFASQTFIRTSGTVLPFVPYAYQCELIKSINDNPNTIVLKSRQTGISETICNYLLCRALTEPGFAAVTFSKTQNDASELGKRVRAMANSLQNCQFKFLTDSNTQLSIVGGGTLFFLPATARAARGIPSCSVLFLDEAAFLEGAQEIYSAAMPTLSMVGDDAKVIVVSTPGTETDFFGQLWLDNSEGAWNCQQVHYSQHPIYSKDKDWADKTRTSRRMTVQAWSQEYELQFGSTDAQVFPARLVDKCARGQLLECGRINRSYVMGVDPAAGGADAFAAVVLDITDQKCIQVVKIHQVTGKSTNYNLIKLQELIEDFLPQRICVEKNGIGAVMMEAMTSYFSGQQIEGFLTSRPSKVTATDRILYLMERDGLIFPPGPIASELKAFRQTEAGAREASAGYHDDLVMALAFACSLVPEIIPTASFFDAI